MTRHANVSRAGAWDDAACLALIDTLWALRQSLLDQQARLAPRLRAVDPAHQASAINLVHYLALRRIDLRQLQDGLARMGVSSLGRAETHVLANVDKVLGVLHRIAGQRWTALSPDEPTGFHRGPALLARNADALFGPPPAQRGVRIMVTLPSAAATDEGLVASLVDTGMDIARINCAHDGADDWVAMADNVRRAAVHAGRPVQVLMDLAGPKLRTGPLHSAPAVIKFKPKRDALGRVTMPVCLGLRAAGSSASIAGAGVCLGVDARWLQTLGVGDRIDLIDARAAKRRLKVIDRQDAGVLVECDRTAYLTADTVLHLHRHDQDDAGTPLSDLPSTTDELQLQRGDRLRLVSHGLGHNALPAAKGRRAQPATIACTLPQALAHVRKGERIWFDDGRIGGVVQRASAARVDIEITDARDGGEHLAADKGINFPDTRLALPALTARDLDDLEVVAHHADIVGMSFAQAGTDVQALRQRLVDLGAAHLGLVLKIETRRGFEHLPEMLLAAMAGPVAGVMIARGDLAVECGYERMAEVQEEILWACEAAHMPVVWATQVLETLAKTGLPSRAEITDAAMGGRAECVMLNKGPHILDAMRTLNNILQRMQAHQAKKRPLLRALKSWDLGAEPAAPIPARRHHRAAAPDSEALSPAQ
ncbi:MAG: pyruvate kinase [Burkholderiales bacterium RIFCSPHIGHO2_12_FULL_69_20]|nr:MAG: pyruvate kinase [Burkholderiales bacterium RIFCSPHIGHO2_12_FULL_69_20]